MTPAQTFDPIAFKQRMRREWSDAAVGWHRWCDVVEGRDGGQRHSAKLVELARVRPGFAVLDLGVGYGEPSLTAAHAVGPGGHVVCTDLASGLLAFAHERSAEA